jgi:hypothetical protein
MVTAVNPIDAHASETGREQTALSVFAPMALLGLMPPLLPTPLTGMLSALTRVCAIVPLVSANAMKVTLERAAAALLAPTTALVMEHATILRNYLLSALNSLLTTTTNKPTVLGYAALGTAPRSRPAFATLTMRALTAPSANAPEEITY